MRKTLPSKILLFLFPTLVLVSLVFFAASALSYRSGGKIALAQGSVPVCSAKAVCPANPSLYGRNDKFAPIIYNMHDVYRNVNWRLWKPDFGPIGGWFYFGWDVLEPSGSGGDFSALDGRLKAICGDSECYVNLPDGSKTFKPAAISVQLMQGCTAAGDCDQTPEWVYQTGVPKKYLKPSADCPQIQVPNFENSAWREAYAGMVGRLAQKYANDPIVDSVWITTGVYGEAISRINFGGCTYDTNPYFQQWAKQLPAIYRQRFGNKPIFMLITRNDMKKDLVEAVAAVGAGIKTNTLAPDTKASYQFSGGQLGLVQYLDLYKTQIPIAFEHAYADNPAQTYWSILYALAHGGDIIDLDGDVDGGDGAAGDHFFRNLKNGTLPWGEPLWDFFARHADRGPGGHVQSDDAWIVLRDTHYPYGGEDTYTAGEPGDWEFHLYRLENTCPVGHYPEGTYVDGTDMCNGKANRDVGGTADFVLGNVKTPGNWPEAGVYGWGGARKTLEGGKMFFLVDPSWGARSYRQFSASITYFGGSGGKFRFDYCKPDGSPASELVDKEAGGWHNKILRLAEVDFSKTCAGLNGGANFALNSDGEADIFHLVAIGPGLNWPPQGGGEGPLALEPDSLYFQTDPGVNPASQTIRVSRSSEADVIDWEVAASDSWLVPSPASGNSGAAVTVTVAIRVVGSDLDAGTHNGALVFKKRGTDEEVARVSVTLRVGGGEPPPTGSFSLKKGWNQVSWSTSYGYFRPSKVPVGCAVVGKYQGLFGGFLKDWGLNLTWPAQEGKLFVRCKEDLTWQI